VRDYAGLLAEELTRENVSCEFHWLRRDERSLRGSRSEIRAWSRELASELAASRPDAILLHYSVFSYSYRGIPLFARPTLSALRASRIPVVSVLHEFAYPWGYGGWRGSVWALTQRVFLREVIAASAAVIVTVDFRAQWLASRPWLPSRRVMVAPVFSSLPAPGATAALQRSAALLGVFGYSSQGAAVAVTLEALRELRARGVGAQLRLLGAPGPSSAAGKVWLAGAQARGVADALSFSGALPAQALSDALAACDVLVFADAGGPSSRKTTLAASLASGAPVVAIDGPDTWTELIRCEAARVVPPKSPALAGAIADLLADEASRRALGARGRAFAQREMAVARSVQAVTTLLDEALSVHGS
jgi:glycosyltransferase involved in cell wall biosynthesis